MGKSLLQYQKDYFKLASEYEKKLGASAVKVFPAYQFGSSFLKELRGPLGQIKLLPTGGVSLENIEHFFDAGAMGVGMGSSLFDKGMTSRNDFESLYLHFTNVYTRVKKNVSAYSNLNHSEFFFQQLFLYLIKKLWRKNNR